MPDVNIPGAPPEAEPERETPESEEARSARETEFDEDELKRKAVGGYGGDTGEATARWAPSTSEPSNE
jgi:hypothetical protein